MSVGRGRLGNGDGAGVRGVCICADGEGVYKGEVGVGFEGVGGGEADGLGDRDGEGKAKG